jgi:ABC-type transporter Mla MlaB component
MERERVAVDCGDLRQPDLPTVDAILRLRLVLLREGMDLVLQNTPPRLRELIDLLGLADLLSGASVEAGRETEERE